MAWPTDYTFSINEISANVWQEIKTEMSDLVTAASDPIFQVAGMRGAWEAWSGGDEWKARAWITDGGVTSLVFNPSDANPTGTGLLTAGIQRYASHRYKYMGITRNVHHNQALPRLADSPRAIVDVIRSDYMLEAVSMLNEMIGTGANGFWNTNAKGTQVSANQFANAKACFADLTSDFADVDVSAYTNWKPFNKVIAAAGSDGSTLIQTDLQAGINASVRQGEGAVTDWFTTDVGWRKIRQRMVVDSVLAIDDIAQDMGIAGLDGIKFAGTSIWWSRRLADDAAWNLDGSSTTTSETPFIGIDFSNFYIRYAPGQGFGAPSQWSPVGLIDMVTENQTPSESFALVFRRLEAIYQYAFRKSRRTSGTVEGLKLGA